MMTDDEKREKLRSLSREAALAMLKGANAMCPGCSIELEVPKRSPSGAALHKLGRGHYECHANTDAWVGVPEWEAESNVDEA